MRTFELHLGGQRVVERSPRIVNEKELLTMLGHRPYWMKGLPPEGGSDDLSIPVGYWEERFSGNWKEIKK
jgi:hypothetical protein